MCEPTTIAVASMGLTAVGTYMQAQGAHDAARAEQLSALHAAEQTDIEAKQTVDQAIIQEQNEKLALWDADQTLRFGAQDESAFRANLEKMKGEQMVAFAGQGIDVQGSRSVIDALAQTARFGEVDAMTLREQYMVKANSYQRVAWNAANEAGMLGADAAQLSADAAMQRQYGKSINPGRAAFGAAVGGVSNMVGQAYDFAYQGVTPSFGASATAGKNIQENLGTGSLLAGGTTLSSKLTAPKKSKGF